MERGILGIGTEFFEDKGETGRKGPWGEETTLPI